MNHHLIGQIAALLAAITWAYALVLFKCSGERIPPLALNLFKNVVGLVLLIITLAVLAALRWDRWDALGHYRVGDLCLLMLSGVIGIALADTLFFRALNLIGVGLIAIVDCTYTPLAILFAWLILSEKLLFWHYAGAALIVAGVFVASRHTPPVNRTRGQIAWGVFLAVLAIAMMAFGIVIAKPILEQKDMSLVWATTVRLIAGTLFLSLFSMLGRRRSEHWRVFRPSSVWKLAIPASVLGSYLSLLMWVAGFKYTYASVAAALNQTSVIFASVFAALILKEHFGRRQVAALALALTGVFCVRYATGLPPLPELARAWVERVLSGPG